MNEWLELLTKPLLIYAKYRKTRNGYRMVIELKSYSRKGMAERAYNNIKSKYPDAIEEITDIYKMLRISDTESYVLIIPKLTISLEDIIIREPPFKMPTSMHWRDC